CASDGGSYYYGLDSW
nr:immunoglobulin heavy chain junction region [Macaca mulatta]MPN84398.1 immunoglobulin heavy chain junction region [Macaca mulatta]MPN84559.1 immunoglobulin heavy chain junction region [Macaca mulatta]